MMDTISAVSGDRRLKFCWVTAGAWLVMYLYTVLAPSTPAMFVFGALQRLVLIAIVLIHSSILYGWPGAACFSVLGILVGASFEISSVATGFPFGSYVHHSPGPRFLGVPLQGMLIYMCYGWYAWIVARVILLNRPERLGPRARFMAPPVAAIILAGFDYPLDPIMSTLAERWTFDYPSGHFGVPITNYLGWIFAGWVIFQILALIDHCFRPAPASGRKSFWLLPCLVWLALAAQFPLGWALAAEGTVSTANRTFVITDIHEAAVIASIFTLVFTGLLAVCRLYRDSPDTPA